MMSNENSSVRFRMHMFIKISKFSIFVDFICYFLKILSPSRRKVVFLKQTLNSFNYQMRRVFI